MKRYCEIFFLIKCRKIKSVLTAQNTNDDKNALKKIFLNAIANILVFISKTKKRACNFPEFYKYKSQNF